MDRYSTKLEVEWDINNKNYDCVILISDTPPGTNEPQPLLDEIKEQKIFNPNLTHQISVFHTKLLAKRLIYSPISTMKPKKIDLSKYKKAAFNGIKWACRAGVKKPLLLFVSNNNNIKFNWNLQVAVLLGALEALYVPLRKQKTSSCICCVKCLGFWSSVNQHNLEKVIGIAQNIESAKYVARDICGAPPEEMSAVNIEDYAKNVFKDSNIKIEVRSNLKNLKDTHPLFEAVGRGASVIPRYRGRLIYLTYKPKNQNVQKTIIIVGAGLSMDTGGYNIKINDSMRGMSRSKCGAATALGFMELVKQLQPVDTKVIVILGCTRNSIDANAYCLEEVITGRSGYHVHISNTDAEKRLILADLMNEAKEIALQEINPYLLSMGNLADHVSEQVGSNLPIILPNDVLKKVKDEQLLMTLGEKLGDPIEVLHTNDQDFECHIISSYPKNLLHVPLVKESSSREIERAVAFILIASGLNENDVYSDYPLKYFHLQLPINKPPEEPKAEAIYALARFFFPDYFDLNKKFDHEN